jgi:hypothetical protein
VAAAAAGSTDDRPLHEEVNREGDLTRRNPSTADSNSENTNASIIVLFLRSIIIEVWVGIHARKREWGVRH